jgi:hypothetical protein
MSYDLQRNLMNEQFGTLVIYSIAGRDKTGSKIWICRCVSCGTSGQTFEHMALLNGAARCKASICSGNKSANDNSNGGTTNIRVVSGGRVRDRQAVESYLSRSERRPSLSSSLSSTGLTLEETIRWRQGIGNKNV